MTKLKTLLNITMVALMISCSDEPFDLFPDDIEKIDTHSELFNSLKSVSENENDDEEPVCITFVYPFNVYLFNEDAEIVDSKLVNNNLEFVTLLGDTEGSDGAIGLSYPITSMLEDGSVFSIQDNAELKTTIEACIESQIIRHLNGVLGEENCNWKITSLTDNQRYNNSFLNLYGDGTGIFYDDGNAYRASWISLFIESKPHINIHLEGDSETAEDWNFDWKAIAIDNATVEISNGKEKYIIKKECDIENLCDYVEFRECELKDSEYMAEFVLDDYVDCILSFRQDTDPSAVSVSFFETYEQAEQETNILDSSAYLNITNPQLVFVKIKNTDTNESQIIKIVLFVEACDNNDET